MRIYMFVLQSIQSRYLICNLKLMSVIIDPEALQIARFHQNHFRQIYDKSLQEKSELKKQGRLVNDTEQCEVDNMKTGLLSLEQAIYFFNQAKESRKVVELCLILMKEEYFRNKGYKSQINIDSKKHKQLKSYIKNNIKRISQREQVNAYITLASIYRRANKKEDLMDCLNDLLNVILMICPTESERQRFRRIVNEAYEQLLINNQEDSGADIWSEFLRYELSQPEPEYQSIIKMIHRHFTQSYMTIILYILMGRYDNAKQILNCFTIKGKKKEMLVTFAKVINLSEKRDFKGLKKIHSEQIYKYKIYNLNIVMKKLLDVVSKAEVKKQSHHSDTIY